MIRSSTFDRTCTACRRAVILQGVEIPPGHEVFVMRPMLTEQSWDCPWCGVENSGRFYAIVSKVTKRELDVTAEQ